MKITIKDIPKMLGVSISTVSRVLNDSKPVNEDIKKRVISVIKQTNYRSGSVLNTLVNNDSSLTGVITPGYSHTILPDILLKGLIRF